MSLADTLPSAQPVYVLRGHAAAIHIVLFFRGNTRLLTGDADGWIVIWSLAVKRPVAVWRAHEATILGAQMWGEDKIITHGRDSKIYAWAFSAEDEDNMSTELPIEASIAHHKQPWLLHTLNIPTVNFCSFASCVIPPSVATKLEGQHKDDPGNESTKPKPDISASQALLAVSGLHDSTIDLYAFPSSQKIGSIPAPTIINTKTGMVMSLKVFFHSPTIAATTTSDLYVIAGYESGRTYVFKRVMPEQRFDAVYTSIPHSQPVLSLDVSPSLEFYVTSSADAIVAKHPLISSTKQGTPLKEVQTRHAGQQGLKMRSDSRIFATAGWDSRIRVYSAKSMKELAVLKWHKEGCYAVAFAEVDRESQDEEGDVLGSNELVKGGSGAVRTSVKQAREEKARNTHWLAAGAKDGKVSLWDIY